MTAEVRSISAQRDREQRRRDNEVIETAENATANWSAQNSSTKGRSSK